MIFESLWINLRKKKFHFAAFSTLLSMCLVPRLSTMSHANAAAIIVHYHCYFFIQKLKVEKRKGLKGLVKEERRSEKKKEVIFFVSVYST